MCWGYTAKYKKGTRIFRVGGPGSYPKKLKLPSNIDRSTGTMVDDGDLIDPSKYIVL